jgi:mevalonate-3-phosphate-5-kinase
MIYWNDDSFLLATGLPLDCVADILVNSSNIDEIEANLMNYGKKYLRRFQIVKEYFNLTKQGKQRLPIIPLVIGMPGIGKTALAKELSTALNIGIVIGGDSLRTTIRQHISRKKNEIFFTSVYNTWKFFGEKSAKTIIEGYKSQANVMNKTIERMIADRGFRDGESMIIEYLHFLPSQFDEEVLEHPSLMPIILKITDKEIYERRIEDRAFYSHLRNSGKRLLSHIDVYLQMQDYLCKEANKFGLQIISINNFEDGFELALNYLIDRIANLNKIKDYKKELRLVKEIANERKND